MNRRNLLVVGGGVAAVEALLALRELAPDMLDVTLLAPGPALVLAPESVAEATGGPPARRFDLAAITAELGVHLVRDALDAVDVVERRATTRDGTTLAYDALLLTLGAIAGPVLPGAVRFGGVRDVPAVRSALERAEGSTRPTIAFVATGAVGWTLPVYELAALVAARFDERGQDRNLIVVTSEAEPLAVFGHTASRKVAHQLSELRLTVKTATMAEGFEGGRLWLAAGGSLAADLVIALPEPRGPEVPGLPADLGGFVPVDRFGRVRGAPEVWAAGDMTARPLKQGGLAVQQADVAARSIAAWAGADVEPQPYEPELRGLLLTGTAPRYLRRSASSTVPSTSSEHPLWSLEAKIAGGRLASYMHTHPELQLVAQASADA
jgi:sulfide:quinone oxidoreductase